VIPPRAATAARAVLPELLLAGLLALAWSQARAVTADLAWPASSIQYREMAMAQTMIDQGFGPDPAYRGEAFWYNPLSGWLVAAAEGVTGRSLPEVVTRSGPFVNILAPLAFYLLVATLAGRWTALAATAGFLFVTANAFPFWEAASYSPWLTPENYGQGLLYAALFLLVLAERHSRSWVLGAAVGVALGLTFLAHTAPALILGAVLVLLAARRAAVEKSLRGPAMRLVWMLGLALLTSLPLVASVVGRYRLAIVNHYPSQAPSTLLDLSDRPALLLKLSLQSPFLPAIAALTAHFRHRRDSPEGSVLLAWAAAVVAFLVYGDARAVAHHFGVELPMPVPTFHFFFHFMSLVSVGFGVALVGVVRAVVGRLAARTPDARRGPLAELAIALSIVACVGAAWPAHAARFDATELRQEALGFAATIPKDALAWIRARTDSDDVFLSTDEMSLYVVSPAGRKVVCTNRYFSNPYVDWAGRESDRARMFDRLRAGDVHGFDQLAARYGVTYVMASDGVTAFLRHQAGMSPGAAPPLTREEMAGRDGFETVFLGEGVGIYRRSSQAARAAGS
jgi:hypothetical protein